jgi:hypothetical protein
MNRKHVALISLLLAIAVTLGFVAATRTIGLGAASHRAADAAYAARVRRLNAFESKLRRELTASTLPSRTTAPAPKIVYHRPPPVVIVHHTHHGDDGSFEAEGGGGGDD